MATPPENKRQHYEVMPEPRSTIPTKTVYCLALAVAAFLGAAFLVGDFFLVAALGFFAETLGFLAVGAFLAVAGFLAVVVFFLGAAFLAPVAAFFLGAVFFFTTLALASFLGAAFLTGFLASAESLYDAYSSRSCRFKAAIQQQNRKDQVNKSCKQRIAKYKSIVL